LRAFSFEVGGFENHRIQQLYKVYFKEVVEMSKKGSKTSNASVNSAEGLQHSLSSLGEIRLKKMFALVDSEGSTYFKADETNLQLFDEAGSSKHSRMPYYRVPDRVLADEGVLQEWAQSSITISKKPK
jgi:TfoX/Sxy family transcriptional regulator of competence genes